MTAERAYPLSFLSAALALLLLAALGAATLWDMLDGPNSPREEAVAKTPKVALSMQALTKLPGDARYYLANRYALKETFIDLDAWVKFRLLGREWTREVMLGENGFLFLRNKDAIGLAQGRFHASDADLAAWAAQFGRMSKAFAARGTPFVFILAPNKHSIYPDHLPAWLDGSDRRGALTDQVIAAAASSDGFAAPDVAAYLESARSRSEAPLLFHRTDTHWTEYGAALAIAEALEPLGFALSPPDIVLHSVGRGGDLSRLTGWRPDPLGATPSIERSPAAACAIAEKPYDLQTIDPLPVKAFTCRNDRARHGEVMVFMDSFGVSAAPTFANAFRASRFFWRDTVDLDLVDRFRPDLVVQILVERKLPKLAPASLMRGDAE